MAWRKSIGLVSILGLHSCLGGFESRLGHDYVGVICNITSGSTSSHISRATSILGVCTASAVPTQGAMLEEGGYKKKRVTYILKFFSIAFNC